MGSDVNSNPYIRQLHDRRGGSWQVMVQDFTVLGFQGFRFSPNPKPFQGFRFSPNPKPITLKPKP